MRWLRHIVAYAGAVLVLLWRWSCRRTVIDDPRPELRRRAKPYVYALLHAHQLAAVMVNDERRMVAMLSRSTDGDLLAPSLRFVRVRPVRGSSRSGSRDKGGRAALAELAKDVAQQVPALLAVDGPRGPRNHVHRGVAELAVQTGAAVLPVVVLASRRFILRRTWDRFQIPKPFSRIHLIFGASIVPGPGESIEALRERITTELTRLEARCDPAEVAMLPRPRAS